MFALVAAILFGLAAFGVEFGKVSVIALGLLAMAIHFIVADWPITRIKTMRRN